MTLPTDRHAPTQGETASPRTDAKESAAEDATTYCLQGWVAARDLERALTAAEQRVRELEREFEKWRFFGAAGELLPSGILEWFEHLELHMTEHDERHAGLALRAGWPHVRDFLMRRLRELQKSAGVYDANNFRIDTAVANAYNETCGLLQVEIEAHAAADRLNTELTARLNDARDIHGIGPDVLVARSSMAELTAKNADLNVTVMTLGQQGTARELYIAKLREELKRERAKR